MKHQLLVVLLSVLFSPGFGLTRVGAEAGPVNLTGTWGLQYMGREGPVKFTFVFKQEGEKLSGTFSGDYEFYRAARQITGTVKGNKVVFAWYVKESRTPYTSVFKGTIESATKMTGTVGNPFCGGKDCTWKATKKK